MLNDLFDEILNHFEESRDELATLGFELKTESDNDSIKIEIKKLENTKLKEEIKEFKEFVNNIEDEFFTSICDKFNAESEVKLNEFDKLMNEAKDENTIHKCIEKYNDVTYRVIGEYIDKLVEKYDL